MGKKKIDKLKFIENKLQRNVAFCKRKRGFLKKAIELSSLCDQQILIVIYDKERKRLVQFSSDGEFQFKAAYTAFKTIKQAEHDNQDNFERFTNDDYENLEKLDFRSVRYKKKHIYGENDEVISELDNTPNLTAQKYIESNAKEDQVSENMSQNKKDLVQTENLSKQIKSNSDRKKATTFGIDFAEENEVRNWKTIKDTNEEQTDQMDQNDSLKDEESQKAMKKRHEKQLSKNQKQLILSLPSQAQMSTGETMFSQPDKVANLHQKFKPEILKLNGSAPQIKFNTDFTVQNFATNPVAFASKTDKNQSISYDISQNEFKVIIPKQRLVQPAHIKSQNLFLNSINQKNAPNVNLKQIPKKFDQKEFQDKNILQKANLDKDHFETKRESQVSFLPANQSQFNSDVNQSNFKNQQENQNYSVIRSIQQENQNNQFTDQLEKEFLNILTQLSTGGQDLKIPEKLLSKITSFHTLQAFLENMIKRRCTDQKSQKQEDEVDMSINQMPESQNNKQTIINKNDPNCQQQIDSYNKIQDQDSNIEKLNQSYSSKSISNGQQELNKQLQYSLGPNQKLDLSGSKSGRSQSAQNQNVFTSKQPFKDANQFAQPSNEQCKGDQMRLTEWIYEQIKQGNNLQQDQSPQNYAEKQPISQANGNNTSQSNSNMMSNQDHQNMHQGHQSNHIFNNFLNISGTPDMNPQKETPIFQAGDLKGDSSEKMAVDLTGWGSLKRGNQNHGFQTQKQLATTNSPSIQQQQNTQDISNLRNILFQQQKITQTISGLEQQLMPQQYAQPQRGQRGHQQVSSTFKPINQMNFCPQNPTLQRLSRSYSTSHNFLPKDTQPQGLKFNSNMSKAQSSHGSLGLSKMLRKDSQSPNASSVSNIKNHFWIANQILNTKAKREKSMLDSISQVSEENSFAFINRKTDKYQKLPQKSIVIERSVTMQNVFTPKTPNKSNIGDQKSHDNISMGLFADQIRDTSHHKI